ncbi:nucleic acid-binding protein (plasmid) [Halococcus dombrowskii]|uniref:Nucleic acid-binding protein n=1 Tax=Halococcus dombrowskii TaxID=179637 RepID=A0AAV3SAA6_HALDO|nr:nucleic acid-binding protein [Halococcus dombrowskii]UOO96852.1 nucleic acid-binding protein [Halococcus dombrowskii]
MSSSASSPNDGRTDREPAKRAFAEEFADATELFQESDDERAPKYAVLPTGQRANRMFAVGALLEAENLAKSGNDEYWQGRVVDPTGTFFVYAGQYQPEAMAALRSIGPPEYVAVVGKPRSYENDNGEVLTSLTPESITVVPEAARDQWVVETADHTMARLDEFAEGPGASPDADRAREAYGDGIEEYEVAAKEALAQVADIELADAE